VYFFGFNNCDLHWVLLMLQLFHRKIFKKHLIFLKLPKSYPNLGNQNFSKKKKKKKIK